MGGKHGICVKECTYRSAHKDLRLERDHWPVFIKGLVVLQTRRDYLVYYNNDPQLTTEQMLSAISRDVCE